MPERQSEYRTVRKRSILTRTTGGWFDGIPTVWFHRVRDDDENTLALVIEREWWTEMGSPESVSVTVESGDTLNDDMPDMGGSEATDA